MQKLKFNFYLSFITFLGTIFSQIIYYNLKNLTLEVPISKYFICFLFFFFLSFIKNNKLRLISLLMIPLLNFFQMMHLEYYGTKIQAFEFFLLFTQSGEITSALKEEINLFIAPIILTIIPSFFIFYFNARFKSRIIKLKLIGSFFILYLIYNPMRTFITGNTWGRQPSAQEFDGMNVYLAGSYFLGKILPEKLKNNQLLEKDQEIKFSEIKPEEMDIIFVIGESLSLNHLSLFGYHKNTTPRLKNLLKDDLNFKIRSGISSGVSTDISLAFIFNSTFGPSGKYQVIKGSNCLFKLAKINGFKTHYYSTQSGEQLRYIKESLCPKFVDIYKSAEKVDPETTNLDAADDDKLIREYEKTKRDQNNFIVLHQRGSHAPQNLRYKKEKFEVTGNYQEKRVLEYDNTVYEFDSFMAKLIAAINKRDKKTMMIFASDHGEGLGENNEWGHGTLNKTSIQIPIIFYSHKFKSEIEKFPKVITHLNLSLYISKLLGFDSETVFKIPKPYIVLGNDMDGFAGNMNVKIEGDQYEIEK